MSINPTDVLMQQASTYNTCSDIYKKYIYSRASHAACVPFDIVIAMQNLFKLPLQALGMPIKGFCYIINFFSKTDEAKNLADKLAGPVTMLKTALKTIAHALNIIFSLTLGMIVSPATNAAVRKWLDDFSNLSFNNPDSSVKLLQNSI